MGPLSVPPEGEAAQPSRSDGGEDGVAVVVTGAEAIPKEAAGDAEVPRSEAVEATGTLAC